jgi:ornithine cyclodeaminase/alanine dehydrogenase-like protein (mu-crystallin family)
MAGPTPTPTGAPRSACGTTAGSNWPRPPSLSVALLRRLRARGVPVFALTNFGVESFAYAETQYDFLGEFDRRYVSGHMKVIKPEPEIFRMVEADCGLPPEALLFADDRHDNIAAAAARGWKTHHFDGPEGWAESLVAHGLLAQGRPAMSLPFIGYDEGEAIAEWLALTQALRSGHDRPKAQIGDTFPLSRSRHACCPARPGSTGMGAAVKTATIFPGNTGLSPINGAVTLFDDATGAGRGAGGFHLVTKWKTAGDSLLAALTLAREDSRNILILGAGTVAASLIEAFGAGFPGARFTIWNRSPDRAEALAARHATPMSRRAARCRGGCRHHPWRHHDHGPGAARRLAAPGQHVDLIGAYRPDMREADDTALRRARLFVDSRDTTLGHIGELRIPLAEGTITRGRRAGRFLRARRFDAGRRTTSRFSRTVAARIWT